MYISYNVSLKIYMFHYNIYEKRKAEENRNNTLKILVNIRYKYIHTAIHKNIYPYIFL